MVKMSLNNMLVLGLVPAELEHLKQGQPLHIPLDDVGLKGQVVVVIPGDSNEQLHRAVQEAADRMERESRPKLLSAAGRVIQ